MIKKVSSYFKKNIFLRNVLKIYNFYFLKLYFNIKMIKKNILTNLSFQHSQTKASDKRLFLDHIFFFNEWNVTATHFFLLYF